MMEHIKRQPKQLKIRVGFMINKLVSQVSFWYQSGITRGYQRLVSHTLYIGCDTMIPNTMIPDTKVFEV